MKLIKKKNTLNLNIIRRDVIIWQSLDLIRYKFTENRKKSKEKNDDEKLSKFYRKGKSLRIAE